MSSFNIGIFPVPRKKYASFVNKNSQFGAGHSLPLHDTSIQLKFRSTCDTTKCVINYNLGRWPRHFGRNHRYWYHWHLAQISLYRQASVVDERFFVSFTFERCRPLAMLPTWFCKGWNRLIGGFLDTPMTILEIATRIFPTTPKMTNVQLGVIPEHIFVIFQLVFDNFIIEVMQTCPETTFQIIGWKG